MEMKTTNKEIREINERIAAEYGFGKNKEDL